MAITIHGTFLPHTDPEASLAFWQGLFDFEVRMDVGGGTMRWITIGPKNQPETSIVLAPPAVDPGVTDDERRVITEMMAKGTYAILQLASNDLEATFDKLVQGGADIVQEPTDQPYGVRDCAVRDPAGNLIRINQVG